MARFLRPPWWFPPILGCVLGLALRYPPTAHACSCAMDPHAEAPAAALQRAGAVFAGKVTRIYDVLSGWTGLPVSVSFDVAQVWKGPVRQRTVIKTGSGGGDCGIDFRLGEDYIVYAYDAGSDPLMKDGLAANICSRTNLLAHAQVDLAAFGAGTVPPPDTGGQPDIVAIAALLGALLLVTGVLVRARRRRASF